MGVVLPGEADAAVQLDGELRGPHTRGHRARRGDRRRKLGLRGARRGSLRVPRGGDGQLGVEQQVGAVVFDGLERADRASELLALLGVLHGHVQARARRPGRFGGRQCAGEPSGHGGGAGNPDAARGGDRDRASGQIQHGVRRRPLELVADQHVLADDEHHDVGVPATEHEVVAHLPGGLDPIGYDPGQPHRTDLRPVGEAGQQRGLQRGGARLHEDRRREHGGQERARRDDAAQLLEDNGQLRQARALAAVLHRNVQPEPAQRGDLLPRRGNGLVRGLLVG